MVLEEVTLHLGIAAAIAMFVAEATGDQRQLEFPPSDN
jgi:hypothetical protein